MSEQIDELIANLRLHRTGEYGVVDGLMLEAADALEQHQAELRQERERADEAANHAELALAGRRNAVAALSRAEEAIARAVEFNDVTDRDGWWHVTKMRRILTEYGKQKGAEHG